MTYKLINDYNSQRLQGEDSLGYETGFHDTFWDIDYPISEMDVVYLDEESYILYEDWEDLEDIL